MPDLLLNKTAVITGGASGIGEATVRKFVTEGAKVLIADMQVDKGEALAAELGDSALFLRTDVCMEDQVAAAINAAVTAWGRVDCLFNNAGFGGVSGEIHETDMGEPYQRTIDAMLTGPIYGMKHVAPIMREQGTGSIVTTASVAGTGGGYGPHVYSAVKAAVINLSRSVAQELGPFGVRVNTVCPGFINTPIFLGQLALQQDVSEASATIAELSSLAQPITRAGQPEDIAKAVCFLASDESTFITGQPLVVDGGLTLGSWQHPDTGGGLRDLIKEIIGEDEADNMDAVYHADPS